MSPTFQSLRHRNYRLYWSGMFLSNVGTWMQRIAQDWLVLVVLGGSAQSVGITTGLQFLPFLVVSPFGGLLADRFDKRKLLICTNAFVGLVGLSLGVLTLTGMAEIWHVYVLALLLGIGTAVDHPTRQSFVSELVAKEDVPNAVALNAASFNAARLIGPAVAGVLIALIGTGWVFILNGASFISPILALMLLRGVRGRPKRDQDALGAFSQLREGVSYLRSRPDLLMVVTIMFGVGTFGMNFQMTIALMATDVYDKGPTAYGLLGSIMAIGTLSGALLAARRRAPRRRVIAGGAVAFGAFEALAGLMPTYTMFAIALVPVGVLAMTVLTAANAYVQISVPQYVRGRIMALYMMLFLGGTPFGAPVIGLVAETLGTRWSLIGGGLLSAMVAIAAVLIFAPKSGVIVRPRLRPRPGLVIISTAPVVDEPADSKLAEARLDPDPLPSEPSEAGVRAPARAP